VLPAGRQLLLVLVEQVPADDVQVGAADEAGQRLQDGGPLGLQLEDVSRAKDGTVKSLREGAAVKNSSKI
jgi:hypothetical protein